MEEARGGILTLVREAHDRVVRLEGEAMRVADIVERADHVIPSNGTAAGHDMVIVKAVVIVNVQSAQALAELGDVFVLIAVGGKLGVGVSLIVMAVARHVIPYITFIHIYQMELQILIV